MSKDAPIDLHLALPPKCRIAIVAARFNQKIVDNLLAGCQKRLLEIGMKESHITIERVPGAMELPVAAQALARTRRYAAIICLGCVIRGDTPHFDYVAGQSAAGIARVALDESSPVIFGVLTTNTIQQALQRIGPPTSKHGHAGQRAADAAVEMIAVFHRLKVNLG
ncbi:MAG TPA: 6,7-dimethyl-8-ribityllumazine synthase [Tepidisphaeraceae bacterium]|jgi:6,7-dimethyl-8-ribityllumazine synthase|nr:6,7-dimethyl-8-ribityllumazine synthase [Tepidisphaeraceae bacterium]